MLPSRVSKGQTETMQEGTWDLANTTFSASDGVDIAAFDKRIPKKEKPIAARYGRYLWRMPDLAQTLRSLQFASYIPQTPCAHAPGRPFKVRQHSAQLISPRLRQRRSVC